MLNSKSFSTKTSESEEFCFQAEDSFRQRELQFESDNFGVHYNEEDPFETGAPVSLRHKKTLREGFGSDLQRPQDVDNLAEKVDNYLAKNLNHNSIEDEQDHISLEELKNKLLSHIVPLEQLRPPAGVATGIDVIDDFLLWKGFPKGDLSLIAGNPGTGGTSLWLSAASQAQSQKKWVAWVNSDCELMPSALLKKKVHLDQLLVVKKPAEASQLFWVLQEMISSTLFDMIGCHINDNSLKSHQLQKLKKLARTYQVALVFISHSPKMKLSSVYSLMIECQGDYFVIKRAAHRPTPFTIPGGLVHADLMSQLTTEPRKLLR